MAGDWLKLEASTPEKGEVLAIAALMGWTDVDLVVGKLFRVWRWFDQQTVDGNARGVTSALLDRVAGVTGFAEAMQSVGWLHITEGATVLPNFDRHNGKTAKARALTARRVNNFKACNTDSNGEVTHAPLPREEKRREVEEKKKDKTSSCPKKSAKEQVESLIVDDELRTYAHKHGQDADDLVEDWRLHFRGNGYRTNQGPVQDARATFMRWIRTAKKIEARTTTRRPLLVPSVGAGPVAEFDLAESEFLRAPNAWTEVRDALEIKVTARLISIEPKLWTIGVDSQSDKDEIRETYGAQIRRRLPARVQVHIVAVRQWLKERKTA